MNKVVSINLNGRAYQLEEQAYDALRRYLEQAEEHLKGNPDRDEIMADFEQAVADKCDQWLGKSKTVVTEKEAKRIIVEMGPVGSSDSDDEPRRSEPAPARRLYQVRDGAILFGVCTGIAAYFNVDVTVVRLAAIVLALVSSGLAIVAYVGLALVLPVARTPEEKAAAFGQRFNADEILERAKARYADLTDREHWRSVADSSRPALERVGSAILRCLRIASAAVATVTGLTVTAMAAAWVAALWSVGLSGRVFGYTLDPSMPAWLTAAFVSSGLYIVMLPVLVAAVVSYRYARRGHVRGSVWWPLAALVLLVLAIGMVVSIPFSSAQIRTVLQDHQGQLNLGAKTVCVGDDVYCHRTPDQIKVMPVPVAPTPPEVTPLAKPAI